MLVSSQLKILVGSSKTSEALSSASSRCTVANQFQIAGTVTLVRAFETLSVLGTLILSPLWDDVS